MAIPRGDEIELLSVDKFLPIGNSSSMAVNQRVPAPEQLRVALERLGWTQAKLGEQIEVSPGVISRWLSGERTPSLEMALRLESELGIPVEVWVGRKTA